MHFQQQKISQYLDGGSANSCYDSVGNDVVNTISTYRTQRTSFSLASLSRRNLQFLTEIQTSQSFRAHEGCIQRFEVPTAEMATEQIDIL